MSGFVLLCVILPIYDLSLLLLYFYISFVWLNNDNAIFARIMKDWYHAREGIPFYCGNDFLGEHSQFIDKRVPFLAPSICYSEIQCIAHFTILVKNADILLSIECAVTLQGFLADVFILNI